MTGAVPEARRWHSVRLDWADERLWVLIEPRTIFEGISDENRGDAADFARERSVKRYNRPLNALVSFWAISRNCSCVQSLVGNGMPASWNGFLA